MEKYTELIQKVTLNYYVIFNCNDLDLNYSPIVKSKKGEKIPGIHLFDKTLKNSLPALWYILHLPRIGLDVLDLNLKPIEQALDQPHNIILVPSGAVDYIGPVARNLTPTLIIYEDECVESARLFEKLYGSKIGNVGISNLSTELLRKHWAEIGKLVKDDSDKLCELSDSLRLLEPNERLVLSLFFYSNQFGKFKFITDILSEPNDMFKKCFATNLEFRTHLNTLMQIAESEDGKLQLEDYSKVRQSIRKSTVAPIIITLPGIPNYQSKIRTEDDHIPELEKEVISFIGNHRAIAKSGVLLELNEIPPNLFLELNLLEEHCKRGGNNNFIWASLKKIGKVMTEHIGRDKIHAIRRSSHITVFSDFPIGLAILEGDSAPLCCIKPISYRPLTPLVRALQVELPKRWQYYIGKKCKVIIAECLEKSDGIRPYSDKAWNLLQRMCGNYDCITVLYYDISSIGELKSVLNQNDDTDMLLISAHGAYDKNNNMAGLCIGKDIWMADDNDIKMPPIVMLSACHVNPRGAGVVSVTDLFLRTGAMAVLGTLIPIDVRRNAILMNRLFTYIIETQEGKNRLKTLDEVWRFVVASNAVNEILFSSKSLISWSVKVKKSGMFPLKQFMLERSVGRIRSNHIYEDTVTVMRELAIEDGFGEHFDAVIKGQGYFPESVFYQFLGCPENVFIHNPIFERF
jgi:hypothetical protein